MECFDVIVVGGGHAGCEAAWAAAKLGAHALLLTMDPQALARMSCNPAIGGLAKGHIVREIDALGGLMGLAADATAIQFRLLNRSKGPAVRGPRSQNDRELYTREVSRMLAGLPNLAIRRGSAAKVLRKDGRFVGVLCEDGAEYRGKAGIITTGTFLRGLIHVGARQTVGGRLAEPSAEHLSDSLREAGLELGRFKTGTPPRLAKDSLDYDRLAIQQGDDPPTFFSFLTQRPALAQLPCWITWTNRRTHEIVQANLGRAPMYTGQIKSLGPRYCPSFETKIVRFAEKDRHQIFLEPEGLESDLIYCNGLSTSLPEDVQEDMIHSVEGLEKAKIVRYGYAIEYDFAPPTQLFPWLEAKCLSGLFLAGQINGTSGYEEAAGQGLVAGINACRFLRGQDPWTLRRDEAYLGVLIDDLVTRGVQEPYRMFTSRAEHRLVLRADNADFRLTPVGRTLGLVDDARWAAFSRRKAGYELARQVLSKERHQGMSLEQWLRRPDRTWADLLSMSPRLRELGASADIAEQAEIEAKYAGYVSRQHRQIERMKGLEDKPLPRDFDYFVVPHLRFEAREKLSAARPISLGQAARVSGITPADIAVLSVHLGSKAGKPKGDAFCSADGKREAVGDFEI